MAFDLIQFLYENNEFQAVVLLITFYCFTKTEKWETRVLDFAQIM
jgi:hypothetical protein